MSGSEDTGLLGPGGAEGQETPYPGDSSGHLAPAFQQLVQSQDGDPHAEAWTGIAADRAQQYITARSNVLDAQNAENQFVTNLHAAKQGLTQMVQQDPGSMDLALDLAGHTVRGLTDMHGNLPEDQRSQAADDLLDHFQQEIVHGGIQSVAETSKSAANQMLDKYGHYLPDDQVSSLRQYADTQDFFRGQDGAANNLQTQRDQALKGYQNATGYLNSMVDPQTGEFRVPPGGTFLQNLVADPAVAPETKLALRAGFGMLNQNGDPSASNPHIIADMVQRAASNDLPQGEVISHLGTGLTMMDASFLNHLVGPQDPQQRLATRQLSDVISSARDTLAHPANGPAGNEAFGRFTNWLLPALQAGGNLTDLTSGNYMQQFAPRVQDYRASLPPRVNNALRAMTAANIARGQA